MTAALAGHVARYLALRRGLGYKLVDTELLLSDLVAYIEASGADHVRVDAVLEWSLLGSTDGQCARRLSVARRFAVYLQAFDPASEVPPTRIFPAAGRRVPHVFSAEEIGSLMFHAGRLSPPLWAASVTTMIGLMAVTGIRPGEARRASRPDVDLGAGQLLVPLSKNGRSRLLPLHASTIEALGRYLYIRDDHVAPAVTALFVGPAGGPIDRSRFPAVFRQLFAAAGIDRAGPASVPRAGDLRHSFAVSTLVGWHAEKVNVEARLPALSAYMGHLKPKDTYWYLEAAPELMGVVADRLADWEQKR